MPRLLAMRSRGRGETPAISQTVHATAGGWSRVRGCEVRGRRRITGRGPKKWANIAVLARLARSSFSNSTVTAFSLVKIFICIRDPIAVRSVVRSSQHFCGICRLDVSSPLLLSSRTTMAETLNLFTSFFEFEAEISINVRRSDVALSLSRSDNVTR